MGLLRDIIFILIVIACSPRACSTQLLGYGRSCSVSTECSTALYLICQEGTCRCQTGYEIHSDTCYAKIGFGCSITLDCLAYLTDEQSSYCNEGVCECRPSYIHNGGYCKGDLGVPCPAASLCNDTYATCESSTCVCDEFHYDSNGNTTLGGHCVTRAVVGDVCLEPETGVSTSDPCTDVNAECTAVEGVLACRCKPSHYDNNGAEPGGTCMPKIAVGESCIDNGLTASDPCNDSNAECSVGSGSNYTCQCIATHVYVNNSNTGLECLLGVGLGQACDTNGAVCNVPGGECIYRMCVCDRDHYDNNRESEGGNCRNISELQVTNITITGVTTSTITVSWTPPPPPKEQYVFGYYVRRRRTYVPNVWYQYGTNNGTYSYTMTNLYPPGAAFNVTVVAINRDIHTSFPRDTPVAAQRQTALWPYTPTNLALTDSDASDDTLTLGFSIPPYDFAITYKPPPTMYIDIHIASSDGYLGTGSLVIEMRAQVYVILNFTSNVNGKELIFAVDIGSEIYDDDNQHWQFVSFLAKTDVQVPSPPRNATCHNATAASILISWEIPEFPNGYLVQYLINVSRVVDDRLVFVSTVMTGNASLQQYEVTGLDPGTAYQFTVYTVNENYTSDSGVVTKSVSVGSDTCRTLGERCSDPGTPGDATQIVTNYESGQVLSFTCNRDGFRPLQVDGSERSYTCQSHGNWSNNLKTDFPVCKDTTAPVLTGCPTEPILYNKMDQVTIPVITAMDNSGAVMSFTADNSMATGDIILVTTNIKFTAVDYSDNKKECTVEMKITGQATPPTITCPPFKEIAVTNSSSTLYQVKDLLTASTGVVAASPENIFTHLTKIGGQSEIVTVTATNTEGTQSTCTFAVTYTAGACFEETLVQDGRATRVFNADKTSVVSTCSSNYAYSDGSQSKTFTCNTNTYAWSASSVDKCIPYFNPGQTVKADVTYQLSSLNTNCVTVFMEGMGGHLAYVQTAIRTECGMDWQPTLSGYTLPTIDPLVDPQISIHLDLKLLDTEIPKAERDECLDKLGANPSVFDIDGQSSVCTDGSTMNVTAVNSTIGESTLGCVQDTYHRLTSVVLGDICLPCTVGESNGGTSTCTPCTDGFYQDTADQSACKICSQGMTPDSNKARCIYTCQPGFTSITGLKPCQPCGVDKYSSDTKTCTNCPSGRSTVGRTGMHVESECLEKCPVGQYSSTGYKNPECFPCPRNFYQAAEGSTTCLECPVDKVTASTGSIDAGNCTDITDACDCSLKGVCSFEYHRQRCVCATGYTGERCEVSLTICDAAPCTNGGMCESGATSEAFTCMCRTAFGGDFCEKDEIDDCQSSSCHKESMCKDEIDSYTCLCPSAVNTTGVNCDPMTDLCDANPCKNGGKCASFEMVRYECTCLDGFTGNTCENETTCGALTDPTNGNVNTSSGTTFGTTATYSCDAGYELNGAASVTCQETGQWSDTPPTCEPDCTPPTIANSAPIVYEETPSTFRSTATVTCATGYSLTGSQTITCKTGGNWSTLPTCDPKDCGTLTDPTNGNVNTSAGTTFGTTATYSCDAGYELNGAASVTCQATGQWSDTPPTCELDCAPPTIPNSAPIVYEETPSTFRSVATVTCATGYSLTGLQTITCETGGNWSTLPTCNPNDCGALPHPTNGNVNTSAGTTFGTTATYSCDTGYELNGAASVTCQATGQWSDTPPTCEPDCVPPTIPNSAPIVDEGTPSTFRSTATVTCVTGYSLTGSQTITCETGGNWSTLPTCNPNDCGALPHPTNGNVNTSVGTTFGTTATYSCDTGYELNGAGSVSCKATGQWSDTPPTCEPDCAPPTIPNSAPIVYEETPSTFRSTATVTCATGYSLTGSQTITCETGGNWSTLPTCNPNDCGALTDPTNGNVNTTSGTTFGTTATYSCDTGYELNRAASVTCQATGQWSDTAPTCEPDCAPLTIPNSAPIVYEETPSTFRSVATVTCATGYSLTGSQTITCETGGSWSTLPTCDPNDCARLTIPNSAVIVYEETPSTFRSTATVTCATGYSLTGSQTITCETGGNWSTLPTCNPNDCGPLPHPHNGKVDTSVGTTFGTTATYSCDAGYELNGAASVTCQATGQWSDTPPTCEPDCAPPTIPNSAPIVYEETPSTFRSVATVTCATGYSLTGSQTITCETGGNWSTLPTCDPNDCGALTDPTNGNVDTSAGTTLGATATYSCDAGYELNGAASVTCQDTGQWSDATPTCEPDCAPPTIPNSVPIVYEQTPSTFRSTATVTCVTGYSLTGSQTITCETGGNWSTLPPCNPNDCADISVTNGEPIYSQTPHVHGSTSTVRCISGYTLSGSATITCTAGIWDVFPTCKLNDISSGIGGSCHQNTQCRSTRAACLNNICSCVTGVYDSASDTCDILPLYDVASKKGQPLPASDDQCSPVISYREGLPIYEDIYKEIYVCTNGLVTLGSPYYSADPKNDVTTSGSRTILAPFYADADVRTQGSVHYLSLDVTNNETDLLSMPEVGSVEQLVNTYGNMEDFKTQFILFVTWDHIGRHYDISQQLDTEETATFELVLVSDAEDTFVIYMYGSKLMNWKSVPENNVWIGYQAAHARYEYTNVNSFRNAALRMDLNVEYRGIHGLMFNRVTPPDIRPNRSQFKCASWHTKNVKEKAEILQMIGRLPHCPCSTSHVPFYTSFSQTLRDTSNDNIICTSLLPAKKYGEIGKECCFDRATGLWTDERPYAGSLFLYNPLAHPAQHQTEDAEAKDNCCYQTEMCDSYYDVRPIGECFKTPSFDFGTSWGDPHFRTLDGLNFTFNGFGEYTLSAISDQFDLQARTEPVLTAEGLLSDATIFSAFAARDHRDNASLHVEMNEDKDGLIVFGNGIDLTLAYNNPRTDSDFMFRPEAGNLILGKLDNALFTLFTATGVNLRVSLGVKMLTINVYVPNIHSGNLTGLLGNFDGDPNNDFIFPNGTVLSPSLTTEELIHEYGQTWTVDPEKSVFSYIRGKGPGDYKNATFRARWSLADVPAATLTEAKDKCDSDTNEECIFDFVVTRNQEVAANTKKTKENAISEKDELGKTIPTLVSCDVLHVTVGQTVTCAVQIKDETNQKSRARRAATSSLVTVDAGTYRIQFLDNNVNATFNVSNNAVQYVQKDDNPAQVRLVTINSVNKTSPAIKVPVVLCSGCSGNGACDFQSFRPDPRATPDFKYARCDCLPEYEGDHCERNFNACAVHPCSGGRNCLDLTPQDQRTQNISFTCSPCPSGLQDDGHKCKDIDECRTNNGNCAQTCANNRGSYQCLCEDGYRTDPSNGSHCIDINECDEAIDECRAHGCNNTLGNYTCTCREGYVYDEPTKSCNKSKDVCNATEVDRCSNTAGCSINGETTACFCNEGYELTANGIECHDIDECKQHVCPQDCKNVNGSFQCVCYTGYRLIAKSRCKVCEDSKWGDNCANDCQCTGQGAKVCHPVRGCICLSGWEGVACEKDVDECSIDPHRCQDVKKTCINTEGSYLCRCRGGYQGDGHGGCKDVDECSNPTLNDCQHTCSNTQGGYTCNCNKGYTKWNKTQCQDIDECALKQSGCEQICENFGGAYNCYCHFGYLLEANRKTCKKVSNPCETFVNLTCSHVCVVEDNSAHCECMQGFLLGSDSQTCTDIDECQDGTSNQCSGSATCTNTDGSYTCKCPTGSKIENDGRTCSPCDEFHYGMNCAKTCNCLKGACDNEKGCVCDSGWTGAQCDQDIDECDDERTLCQRSNSLCHNIPGTYACNCVPGYRKDSQGSCIDIDECKSPSTHTCAQICHNTQGSFECSCKPGFLKNGNDCEDIDECSGSNKCQHKCDNTIGSYRCYCDDGFRLNLDNRQTCELEHECNSTMKVICSNKQALCVAKDDVQLCYCQKGFQMNTSSDTCEDIKECDTPSTCGQLCTETEGSYKCSCNPGFHLQKDERTCQECSRGSFGTECNSTCSCNMTNTASCDRINGTCTCKPGWMGDTCNNDVNECSNASLYQCPSNSTCRNVGGAYTCDCHSGFLKTSSGNCEDKNECKDGSAQCEQTCVNVPGAYRCECAVGYTSTQHQCIECSSNTYGPNCTRQCPCVSDHSVNATQSCGRVDGICTCQSTWTGDTCTDDVNECTNVTQCSGQPNTGCYNTQGGYECDCLKGFVRYSNGSCLADTRNITTTISPGQVKVSMTVRLEVKLSNDTDLRVTAVFNEVSAKVEASLTKFLRTFIKGDFKIVIIDLRIGSLVVDYELVYDENEDNSQQVGRAIVTLATGTSLTYGNQTVTSQLDSKGNDSSPCALFTRYVGPCPDPTSCVVDNGAPTCKRQTPADNYMLTVAIVSGAIMFCILVAMGIVCIGVYRRRKQPKDPKLHERGSESLSDRPPMSWAADYKQRGWWTNNTQWSQSRVDKQHRNGRPGHQSGTDGNGVSHAVHRHQPAKQHKEKKMTWRTMALGITKQSKGLLAVRPPQIRLPNAQMFETLEERTSREQRFPQDMDDFQRSSREHRYPQEDFQRSSEEQRFPQDMDSFQRSSREQRFPQDMDSFHRNSREQRFPQDMHSFQRSSREQRFPQDIDDFQRSSREQRFPHDMDDFQRRSREQRYPHDMDDFQRRSREQRYPQDMDSFGHVREPGRERNHRRLPRTAI